jgi:hypothetical protein
VPLRQGAFQQRAEERVLIGTEAHAEGVPEVEDAERAGSGPRAHLPLVAEAAGIGDQTRSARVLRGAHAGAEVRLQPAARPDERRAGRVEVSERARAGPHHEGRLAEHLGEVHGEHDQPEEHQRGRRQSDLRPPAKLNPERGHHGRREHGEEHADVLVGDI